MQTILGFKLQNCNFQELMDYFYSYTGFIASSLSHADLTSLNTELLLHRKTEINPFFTGTEYTNLPGKNSFALLLALNVPHAGSHATPGGAQWQQAPAEGTVRGGIRPRSTWRSSLGTLG